MNTELSTQINQKLNKHPLIVFKDVTKVYHSGEVTINAANGINFEINQGEFVIVVGPSGAGKTTVLNILGGMDNATDGEVIIDEEHLENLSQKELTEYRRYDTGFVFQFYNLIQNLTALENVEMAAQVCENPADAKETLEKVGLIDRINNFPSQLSGGEQQRVAIARALVKQPKLLLCDEPTGALDYKTGKTILKLLQETSQRDNMTVILITHNTAITPIGNRVIHMKNGKVEQIEIQTNPISIDEIEW